MFESLTLSALLLFHCQLSLSFDSGAQAACSGQIIGPQTLLTAEHCVSHGSERNPLIVAECGGGTAPIYFIDQIAAPPPALSADHVQLAFAGDRGIPGLTPASTPPMARYVALYFEVNGQAKTGVECFVLNRNSQVIYLSPSESSLRYDRETKTIRSTAQSGDQILVPGDSGSPLYCKSPFQHQIELVGVTSKVLSPHETNRYIGNRFSTFFQ